MEQVSGDLKSFTEKKLFGDSLDTVESHTQRKKAVGDSIRYCILFKLYHEERLHGEEIKSLLNSSQSVEESMKPLANANLVGRIPDPDESTYASATFHITFLGNQEIESDIENIE